MKISFMTFACPTWNLQQALDAAVRHGYHGIEIRSDANHAHGVEITATPQQRRDIRDRFEGAGIEPCCLATSLQFATNQVLEQAPARIELAHDIGCPALRVFCGPKPESMSMPDVIDKVGTQLRAAAIIAEQAGVQLWLETHDTFCRAADAGAAARMADHPAVGINWDNMHPARLGEPLEATVAALGSLVRHTHFHDAINKPDTVVIRPLDQGDLPMDAMFQELIKMGFNGYLSGEWFNTMYGEDPDSSLAAFKRDMTTLAERNGVKIG